MLLTSPDLTPNAPIPQQFEYNGFGCHGENKSPALAWSGAPQGTQSYAVTVYDPDAPTGSGWWHWVVVNLPAGTTELKPNAGAEGGTGLPAGARQIKNDYGYAGWGGVCPPQGHGPHRYVFTVYALKEARLDLPQDATAALAGFTIQASMLEKATFTATYQR